MCCRSCTSCFGATSAVSDRDGDQRDRPVQRPSTARHRSPLPQKPDDAMLERVTNPQTGTSPEFTSLPETGQPDPAHLVIDWVPGRWLVETPAERSATTGLFTRTAWFLSADDWSKRSPPNGCESGDTGIRAAASDRRVPSDGARTAADLGPRKGRNPFDVPESWVFTGYLCLGYAESPEERPLLHRSGWQHDTSTEWLERRRPMIRDEHREWHSEAA